MKPEETKKEVKYVAVAGNIGAGKTSLSKMMSDEFNAKVVLERFADNPFLPKFYEDEERYAFPLEMSFLADRYQQLSDDLAQFDLFKNLTFDFVLALSELATSCPKAGCPGLAFTKPDAL